MKTTDSRAAARGAARDRADPGPVHGAGSGAGSGAGAELEARTPVRTTTASTCFRAGQIRSSGSTRLMSRTSRTASAHREATQTPAGTIPVVTARFVSLKRRNEVRRPRTMLQTTAHVGDPSLVLSGCQTVARLARNVLCRHSEQRATPSISCCDDQRQGRSSSMSRGSLPRHSTGPLGLDACTTTDRRQTTPMQRLRLTASSRVHVPPLDEQRRVVRHARQVRRPRRTTSASAFQPRSPPAASSTSTTATSC